MAASTSLTRTIGKKRHHLLFHYEWMILVGLSEQNLRVRRHTDTRRRCQHRHIFADQVFLDMGPGATPTIAVERERSL